MSTPAKLQSLAKHSQEQQILLIKKYKRFE